MMKLYTSPGACSTACHIVLQESGLPFEVKLISFDQGDASTPAFLKLNPMGAVPVLELKNGEALTEGVAIMQYIADQKPEANLFPKTGMDRYRALEWMNFISTELHKGSYGNLFAAESLLKDEKNQEEFSSNVKANLNEKLGYVNSRLTGKKFCMGDQFTAVDAYLFTILNWSKHLDVNLAPFKNITEFQARTFERPAVQKAMKAEGLIR